MAEQQNTLDRRAYLVLVFDLEGRKVSVDGSPFVNFRGFMPYKREEAHERTGETAGETSGDPFCQWECRNGTWKWCCYEGGTARCRESGWGC